MLVMFSKTTDLVTNAICNVMFVDVVKQKPTMHSKTLHLQSALHPQSREDVDDDAWMQKSEASLG